MLRKLPPFLDRPGKSYFLLFQGRARNVLHLNMYIIPRRVNLLDTRNVVAFDLLQCLILGYGLLVDFFWPEQLLEYEWPQPSIYVASIRCQIRSYHRSLSQYAQNLEPSIAQ